MTTSKKPTHHAAHHVSHPTAEATPVSRFHEAYDRFTPAMHALDDASILGVNLDIPSAATTVIGAVPEIVSFRPEIVATLPKMDLQNVDALEGYALATLHAHALYMAAAAPAGDLAKLSEEATALRDTLYVDATTLAHHNLIDGQRLTQIRTATGYKNVALDLLSLAALLREAWPRIQGKSAIELTALDQAETLADRIITTVGAREQAPAVVAEVAQMRARAFTLMVRAYDEVRRTIGFLRWKQDDLDTIAPSLYAGRGPRKSKGEASSSDLPAPGTSTQPAVNATTTAAAPAVHNGLPGASPFASN